MGTVKIDFFDVDHTVIRYSSGIRFLTAGVSRKVFPAAALLYVPYFYLRYRLGRLKVPAGRWEFGVLKGRSRQALEELAAHSFESLQSGIFTEARQLIQRLKDEGHRIVFATSSIDLIVRPLAQHLGIDDVLATSFEFEDGRSTGRFAQAPLIHEQKKRVVLDYIGGSGALPRDCSFHSDSVQDLPLLEAVGEPVAVNPDRRLRRVALRRGWRILRFF